MPALSLRAFFWAVQWYTVAYPLNQRCNMSGKSTCSQAHVDRGMEYVQGGYEQAGESVPTAQGLALYMDVSRMTPYNWAEQESCKFREEMAYIIDRVQAIQAVKIINGGLTGAYNPAFAGKLVGNHGFSDRQEIDHSSTDGSMKPTNIILSAPDDHSET